MRIICCRFGTKFTDWHVNNLKHMIDNYSGLSYDSFEVIENDIYGNWYNKLPNLIRKEFTLLDDTWWREPAHTPLNSSIVSWTGDKSWIWDKFKSNDTEYLKVYNKGSDEFYYKQITYETYDKICPSIKDYVYEKPKDYSIVTLGQMHHILEEGWNGWWSNYLLSQKQL